MRRYLARQFARPSGPVGRLLVGPWLDRIARRMNRLALDRLDVRPHDRVLEIGFGGGALLAALLDAGARVSGVEISEAMLERARRRFGEKARLFRASAEALPLPDASADRAVSVNSLYFWPDPAGAMAELARVVRPGGTLVLCFEPADELRKWSGHRFGFRPFEVEEVRRLMEAAGFGGIAEAWGEGRKPDRFCCLSGTRLDANG
jgi:arsenite methyltransferase